MRPYLLTFACLCSILAYTVAVPVPASNQELDVLQIPLADGKEIDVLTLGAHDQEAIIAERNKRTIGLLRDLFPDLTKEIDGIVNRIIAQVIRVAGPDVLRSVLGNRSSTPRTGLDADFDDFDDDNDDDTSGNSIDNDSTATSATTLNSNKSKDDEGSRVQIDLPTFPPESSEKANVSSTTESSPTFSFGTVTSTTSSSTIPTTTEIMTTSSSSSTSTTPTTTTTTTTTTPTSSTTPSTTTESITTTTTSTTTTPLPTTTLSTTTAFSPIYVVPLRTTRENPLTTTTPSISSSITSTPVTTSTVSQFTNSFPESDLIARSADSSTNSLSDSTTISPTTDVALNLTTPLLDAPMTSYVDSLAASFQNELNTNSLVRTVDETQLRTIIETLNNLLNSTNYFVATRDNSSTTTTRISTTALPTTLGTTTSSTATTTPVETTTPKITKLLPVNNLI